MEEWLKTLAQDSPGIAALVLIVVLFLRYNRRFLDLIANHISESTKATQKNAEKSEHLADSIDNLLQFLRLKNGKQ